MQLPKDGRWKLEAQCLNSIFQRSEVEIQFPEDASWETTSGVWKLDFQHPLFRKLEVGLEEGGSDQSPQYFFRAKTCVKTRKNGSLRGGTSPGRNARGNPWGPVRTREDPWGPAPPTRLVFLTRSLFFVLRDECGTRNHGSP